MLSALTVVQPAAQPLVPLDLARRQVRIDTPDDDDLLAFYVATATESAELFLGRALLTQTLRWTMMDAPPAATGAALPGLYTAPGAWTGFPHALQRPLLLPRAPVQAVLQVALGDPEGGPDQVLDPSLWVADTALEPARLRLRQQCLGRPMRHVAVTFRAGYGDTPDSVPKVIQMGVLLTVAWLWENRGDVEGDMPPAAERLLWLRRMVTLGG